MKQFLLNLALILCGLLPKNEPNALAQSIFSGKMKTLESPHASGVVPSLIDEDEFMRVAEISNEALKTNSEYTKDMEVAREQMMLSLSYLQKDPEFIEKMNAIGIAFENFSHVDLIRIREDIWKRFSTLLNVAFYVTQPEVRARYPVNTYLEFGKKKYRDLTLYMEQKKYIPPVDQTPPHSFWSSILGKRASYAHAARHDSEFYLNDAAVARYYARILRGWSTEDIRRISKGKLSSLSVVLDLFARNQVKGKYQELSKFFWDAHSMAYAHTVLEKSKVKFFVQESLQEDNWFFRAELPVLREKQATIELVFLEKKLEALRLNPPKHLAKLLGGTERLMVKVEPEKPTKLDTLLYFTDGTLLQLTKLLQNPGSLTQNGQDYQVRLISTNLKAKIPELAPDETYVYLTKKEVSDLFQPVYTAKWVEKGSIDALSPDIISVRSTAERGYTRDQLRIRGWLTKETLSRENLQFETLEQLAEKPLEQECLYTASNLPRVSLWTSAYRKVIKNEDGTLRPLKDIRERPLFGAYYTIKELVTVNTPPITIIERLSKWYSQTQKDLRNDDERDSLLSFIKNDIISEFQAQVTINLNPIEVDALIKALKSAPLSHIREAILATLE